MPKYDYRCDDTGKYFEVEFKTYDDYDAATIVSPFTGSQNVTRIIRRVGLVRSESTRWDRIEAGDEAALQELENADPRTLGRTLRHLGDRVDEDMGHEFHEVVDRLEDGQTPDDIEREMPVQDDGRWLEGLGEGVPGTPSYNPDAPPPPGHEED